MGGTVPVGLALPRLLVEIPAAKQRLTGLVWLGSKIGYLGSVEGLSPELQAVLDAIRELDAEADEQHPTIYEDQVNDKLGRPDGDDATDQAVVELTRLGWLEAVDHIQRLAPYSMHSASS